MKFNLKLKNSTWSWIRKKLQAPSFKLQASSLTVT